MNENKFYCYCLQTLDGRKTYIGATVDPDRRLRQHNGQIKGGARATRANDWERVALIGGFPSWSDALKFEWRWKQIKRRRTQHRWQPALEELLALDKPTESATPYSEYPAGGPLVHIPALATKEMLESLLPPANDANE